MVDDQGNAVGVSDSTAETMNPAEGGQGNAVGNGQPNAQTMSPNGCRRIRGRLEPEVDTD